MKIERYNLKKISDSRGALSFVENGAPLPFTIGRTICIHSEQSKQISFKELSVEGKAFVIALSGSCKICATTQSESQQLQLTTPDCGVLIAEDYASCELSMSDDSTVVLLTEADSESSSSEIVTNGASSSVEQCRILKFNHGDNGISLTNGVDIPFNIKRAYYLYDVPASQVRGAHAHKELYQLIIPLNGSFDVVLNDGHNKRRFTLSKQDEALLVVPGLWRDLENFSSTNTVCLVLASMLYSEQDYIRNYQDFLQFKLR